MRLACLVVLAACSHGTAPATVSLVQPLPTASIAPVSEKRVVDAQEMELTSEHGPVHLFKDGDDRFAGTYSSGVMTCSKRADVFTCHWYQFSTDGTAKLRREGDRLEGTWDGEEADEDDPAPRPFAGTLDGAWDSNWGPATFATKAGNVRIDYGDGSVDCTTQRETLSCTWQENGTSGLAELVIESAHVVKGRWGTGASKTDGGVWIFVRR